MSLVETDIGTIAPDWKVVPLKDVAEKPQYGLTAKAAKSGDTRFLRITDITEQGVNWATVPFCSAPKKKIDPCRLKSGDIVFARIGATTGKSYMITEPPDAVFASYLIRVRAGKDLEPGFLIQFFQSRAYWQQVDANKHANLKKGVNGSILSELLLPLPSLPEQKKIAHILSTVQQAIEAQERIIQTTTELKKALMHKLFTEGLPRRSLGEGGPPRHEPQKQTEIGTIPESWEVVRIKATGTVVTGSTPSTKNPDFYGGDCNLISPADLDNGKYIRSAHKTLTKAGFEECRKVFRDSVLVGCIGNVGKLGMVADDCSTTNQQINSITPNSGFSPHFLYYALQLCRPRLEQAAAKVTLPILNKSNFENFQIAAPERKEQDAIAGYLGILDQKLENAGQKKAQLKDLFRTLLHELMTAKTRVHELEIAAKP